MNENNRNKNKQQLFQSSQERYYASQQTTRQMHSNTFPRNGNNPYALAKLQREECLKPITHHKYGVQQNLQMEQISNASHSATPESRQQQLTDQSQSFIDENIFVPDINDLNEKYNEILKNMNSDPNGMSFNTIQECTSQLYNLYATCVNFPTVENKGKGNAYQLRNRDDEIEFITLLVNVSLNLWKLMSEIGKGIGADDDLSDGEDFGSKRSHRKDERSKIKSKNQRNRVLSPLEIVSKAAIKIFTFLNIPYDSLMSSKFKEQRQSAPSKYRNESDYSLQILPDSIKNRFVLLLIMWGKQELSLGYANEALKICNICSYQIFNSYKPSGMKSSKMGKSTGITNEIKFKFHYLRVRIFNQLTLYREELEEIFICQQLLRGIKNVPQQNQQNQQQDFGSNNFRQKKQKLFSGGNTQNLLKKFEKRKQQIQSNSQEVNIFNNNPKFNKNINQTLAKSRDTPPEKARGGIRITQNYCSINANLIEGTDNYLANGNGRDNNGSRKLKQARDSLKISHNQSSQEIQYNNILNVNKMRVRSLKKSRSFSTSELKVQQNLELNEMGNLDNMNLMSSIHGFNNDEIIKRQNKSLPFKNRTFSNEKSQSFQKYKNNFIPNQTSQKYLKRSPTGNLGNNNAHEKYQVKSKKLVKKAMLSTNKSKQYENVLLTLQKDTDSALVFNLKAPTYHFSYGEMLAKRPEAHSQRNSNLNTNNNLTVFLPENKDTLNLGMNSDFSQSGHYNTVNANQSDSSAKLFQSAIINCIEIVEKEVLEKYFNKQFLGKGHRLEKQINYIDSEQLQNTESENECEGEQNHFNSSQSEEMIRESCRISQQAKQVKYMHKIQTNFDQFEPSLEVTIKDSIFPGLGKCKEIKVVIQKQKVKQTLKDSQQSHTIFIMSVRILSQFGIFWCVHRMPESLMAPKISIQQNLKQKINVSFVSVIHRGSKGQSFQEQEEETLKFKDQTLTKKRILEYIKNNLVIINKGLGPRIEVKKQSDLWRHEPKEEQIMTRMSYFNRIYSEIKQSMEYLYSQNGLSVEPKQSQLKLGINSYMTDEQEMGKIHWKIIDKLRVVYVEIQKKSGSDKKKAKSFKKFQEEQKDDSIEIFERVKPSKTEKRDVFGERQKRCTFNEEKNTAYEPNQAQNIQSNGETKQIDESEIPTFSKILVPIVKHILLNDTSKPKHKLKTIIIRSSQSSLDFQNDSIFYGEDWDFSEHSRSRSKSSKSLRYTQNPRIDGDSRVKVRRICTNIYFQIINKFFMGAGNRNQKYKKSKNFIPEDVMLSLKYELMISNHRKPSKNQQQSKKENHFLSKIHNSPKTITEVEIKTSDNLVFSQTNILERFYDKIQYSFVVNLNKNREDEKSNKKFVITATCFKVKSLYRQGLQKFFLLKFEIFEKSSRIKKDQFTITSFDIAKHFDNLGIELNNLIQKEIQFQRADDDSVRKTVRKDYDQHNNVEEEEESKPNTYYPKSSKRDFSSQVNGRSYGSPEVSIQNQSSNSNMNSAMKGLARTEKIDYQKRFTSKFEQQGVFLPMSSFPISKKSNFNEPSIFSNSKIKMESEKQDEQKVIKIHNQQIESASSFQFNTLHRQKTMTADDVSKRSFDIFGFENTEMKIEKSSQLEIQSKSKDNNISEKEGESSSEHDFDLSNDFSEEKQKNFEIPFKSKKFIDQSLKFNIANEASSRNIRKDEDQLFSRQQSFEPFQQDYEHVKVVNNFISKEKVKRYHPTNLIGTKPKQTNPSNEAGSTKNRLSCPDNNKMKQIPHNRQVSCFAPSSLMTNNPNESKDEEIQDPKNEKEKGTSIIRNAAGNERCKTFVNFQPQVRQNRRKHKKKGQTVFININENKSLKKIEQIQTQNKQSLVECLKRISQKISIYKTQVYRRIGIQSIYYCPQFNNIQEPIEYYSNKFRFSKNKQKHSPQQFLSPHLKSLEFVFQKTTKITCDGVFAIVTIFRVKHCTEFYLKIYVPSWQKTLSFSLSHKLFLYLSSEELKEIFEPYLGFDYQSFKFAREQKQKKRQEENAKVEEETEKQIKNSKRVLYEQIETDKTREIKYMVQIIEQFFSKKSTIQVSQFEPVFIDKQKVNDSKNVSQQSISSKSISMLTQSKQNFFNESSFIKKSQPFESDISESNKIKVCSKQNLNIKGTQSLKSRLQNKSLVDLSKQDQKIVWSKILKHLSFERRSNSTYFKQKGVSEDMASQKTYLIAKIGGYEGFIKNFSVEEYICIEQVNNTTNIMNLMGMMAGKSSSEQSQKQYSILRIQVSMQEKIDGLNFIPTDKKELNKTKVYKRCKKQPTNPFLQLKTVVPQKQYSYIYESQTNKQMVYISISDAKNGDKICFCYYLCELLHLIDYSRMSAPNSHSNPINNDSSCRVQSKQFKQMILNYSLLFKVLNYVKNQYIIELQNNNRIYIPKVYKDSKLRQSLKANVDKILLEKYKQQMNPKYKRRDFEISSDSGQQKHSLASNLMFDLSSSFTIGKLSKSTKLKKDLSIKIDTVIQEEEQEDKFKNSPKVTFNSHIFNQKFDKLCFLVRKTISKKGYPIICMYYSENENKFVFYLSNFKKGIIKETESLVEEHSMPFVNVINMNKKLFKKEFYEDEMKNKMMRKQNKNFLLAFRNRLLQYHHNSILLL